MPAEALRRRASSPPIDTGNEAAGFCIAQMRIFHLRYLENSLYDSLEVRRADPSLGEERSSVAIALERNGAKHLG